MIDSTAVDTNLLAVARRYAAAPHDWPFAPRFDPVSRWYGRLATDTHHEVWLLTWLPGQHTDLHDHGGSAGAFTVVAGELTEETLGRGPRPAVRGAVPRGAVRRGAVLRSSVLRAGQGRRFGSHHIHRIVNTGSVPAISVHAYGPALTAMTRYRLRDGELRVEAVDRAGVRW